MDDIRRIDLNAYCTASEFAAQHGVSAQRVHQWIASGRVPCRRAAGRVWILRSTPRPSPRRPGPAPKTG